MARTVPLGVPYCPGSRSHRLIWFSSRSVFYPPPTLLPKACGCPASTVEDLSEFDPAVWRRVEDLQARADVGALSCGPADGRGLTLPPPGEAVPKKIS